MVLQTCVINAREMTKEELYGAWAAQVTGEDTAYRASNAGIHIYLRMILQKVAHFVATSAIVRLACDPQI
uniref:Uncharacterized protein n=1 Tax=Arundo donax TaxID=35708 RepID=A0A0A9E9G6_ARUDO